MMPGAGARAGATAAAVGDSDHQTTRISSGHSGDGCGVWDSVLSEKTSSTSVHMMIDLLRARLFSQYLLRARCFQPLIISADVVHFYSASFSECPLCAPGPLRPGCLVLCTRQYTLQYSRSRDIKVGKLIQSGAVQQVYIYIYICPGHEFREGIQKI